MPGLGIGTSTPFAMPSNHQTAFNHSFRDVAPYNPHIQARVKCAFCGVWARKGSNCYLCKRWVPGTPVPRDNSVRVEPAAASRSQSSVSHIDPNGSTPSVISRPRSTSSTVRRSASAGRGPSPGRAAAAADGSYAEQFRRSHSKAAPEAVSTAKPVHDKVKCRSCGCWAVKAKPCRLCHTITM